MTVLLIWDTQPSEELKQALQDIDELKLEIEGMKRDAETEKLRQSTLEAVIGKAITNMPTRSLFTGNCFIKRVADGEVVVGCASETLATVLKQPVKLEALSQAISKVLGSPHRLTIVVEKRASN